MKKLLSILTSLLITAAVLCSTAVAETYVHTDLYKSEHESTLIKFSKESLEKAISYYKEEMIYPGIYGAYFFGDLFSIKLSSLSRDRILTFKKTPGKFVEDQFFAIDIYTSDYKKYVTLFDIADRTTFTTMELTADIPEDSEIVFALFRYQGYEYEDHNVEIKNYKCTEGWNKIMGKDYYVYPDGTLATKSTIIDGVRYKFTSDGVCHGKYTGWTKSSAGRKYWKDGKMLTKSAIIGGVRYKIKSNGICEGKYTGWTTSDKGKRYWKNGLLVTEKYIRTTSGKRYYADKNGYVTVVNN